MDLIEALLIWVASCMSFFIPLIVPVGSYGFYKHAARHTDGTDDIQNATNTQKGLATAAQVVKLESALQNLIEDLSPQLSANLDAKNHSINNVLTIDLDGGQIAFPAAQQASGDANTLDDYEEGNWTGALVPAAGSITMNGSFVTGAYTKIGRKVTVTGDFKVSSVSSPTGGLTLTGLPFTSGTGTKYESAVALQSDNLEATATTAMEARIYQNSDTIDIFHFAAGVVSSAAADIKANSLFRISATYFV